MQVLDGPAIEIELNIQCGQLTLRSQNLKNLPTNIAGHCDILTVFGDAKIEAAYVGSPEGCDIYKLISLDHEIIYWNSSVATLPPHPDSFAREYDPATIKESEKWIVNVSWLPFISR